MCTESALRHILSLLPRLHFLSTTCHHPLRNKATPGLKRKQKQWIYSMLASGEHPCGILRHHALSGRIWDMLWTENVVSRVRRAKCRRLFETPWCTQICSDSMLERQIPLHGRSIISQPACVFIVEHILSSQRREKQPERLALPCLPHDQILACSSAAL